MADAQIRVSIAASHVHVPWAEKDGDGMYEPTCDLCTIFADDQSIAAVMRRWSTHEEAVAAATAVIAMLGREQ